MSTSPTPAHGGARSPQPASPDFFLWIRSLGLVRGQNRWAGGVASGLADRWRVSPALVRFLFVVAALFLGIGLLAYGVLWLLLPEPDGRIHVQEALHGRWSGGMVGGLVATFFGLGGLPASYSFGNIRWAGPLWALFWAGILLLVVYGIATSGRRHRTRRVDPEATPHSPAATPQGPAPEVPGTDQAASPYTASASGLSSGAGRSSDARPGSGYGSTPAPPRWEPRPAVARPFEVRQRRRGPGGPFTAIVLGLTALVVGGLLELQTTGVMVIDPSTGALWATGAAIIGLGIIVAGLRGRTGGVLSIFAVLALIVASVTEPAYVLSQAHSPTTASPSSIAQATEGYTATAASAQFDLRALDTSGPLASEAVVPVTATMSDLRIEIPKNLPVRVQADGAMSNIQFGGRTASGLALSDSQTYNTSRSGAALVITVHAVMSNVTVEQEQ